MRESTLWNYVKKGMLGKWHATRIESSAGNGIPDVSYGLPGVNGFLELKLIPSWPVRKTTNVKLPLRPEQKHWIKARGELSGEVFVLVRIDDWFFLLNHTEALKACDGYTKEGWVTNCNKAWHKSINFNELVSYLGSGCDCYWMEREHGQVQQ